MRTLGRAIGSYLAQASGQFSVVFPRDLQEDLVGLIERCQELTGDEKRALFVTNRPPGNVESCTWQDLLSWRTGHDRVFAWIRGSGQPDSSFQSVVQPFIDETFPGEGSTSICTLPLLARVCLDYIWEQHGLGKGGNVYDKFLEMLTWALREARGSFLRGGNTAHLSWNDQFLVHGSRLVSYLEQIVAEQAPSLVEAHAWEIERLAGLPAWVEDATRDDVFLSAPPVPREGKASMIWEKVVSNFITGPLGVGELLGELDKILKPQGRGGPNSWWGLLDNESVAYDPSRDAPLLYGQRLFTSPGLPALFSTGRPGLHPAPRPAWWGVVSSDLAQVLNKLRESQPLRPANDDTYLHRVPGMPGKYVLRTRLGNIEHDHKKRYWQAKVSIGGVAVVYETDWKDIILGDLPQEGSQVGQIHVSPETVQVSCSPRSGITCLLVPGGVYLVGDAGIRVEFDIEITYKADRMGDALTGAWQPSRSLKVSFLARDWDGSKWLEPRKVEGKFDMIVPHPFELTVMLGDAGGDGSKKGNFSCCPGKADVFSWEKGKWEQKPGVDIQVKADGEMNIATYDGRLDPGQPSFLDQVTRLEITPGQISLTPTDENLALIHGHAFLDEGSSIEAETADGNAWLVTSITVEEQARKHSSGLLRSIQDPGSRPGEPTQEARQGLLGHYQDAIRSMLASQKAPSTPPVSLFQVVVGSGRRGDSWPRLRGSVRPDFIGIAPCHVQWIGDGPSQEITTTPEWKQFLDMQNRVLRELGIMGEHFPVWVSTAEPSRVGMDLLRGYLAAHRALILAAGDNSKDRFWVTYPHSIIVVESNTTAGPEYGLLKAIFLGPLHPARLAWAYSVARLGGGLKSQPGLASLLMGLADGWNIPATGFAPGPGSRRVRLVAIPVEMGKDADFAAWSALAVLNETTGLPALPVSAGGVRVPWAGRTGVNENIVRRVVGDYLDAHPYVTSLALDLRSVVPGARSREIDMALINLLSQPGNKGVKTQPQLAQLGGGIRVWDSASRDGPPPTRDDLVTTSGERIPPFEWQSYKPPLPPAKSIDISIIEDAKVNISPDTATAAGDIGPLPLKRFTPTQIEGDSVIEQVSIPRGRDLLGLADLLAVMEQSNEQPIAFRADLQDSALGLGGISRWEILGTLHLDSARIARYVSRVNRTPDRILWEWRPSWLRSPGKDETNLGNRPYFVIARVPRSLQSSLSKSLGLGEDEIHETLLELGRRGIGFVSLMAKGGTQEAAALGFYCTYRLLIPPTGTRWNPRWLDKVGRPGEDTTFLLLPLDPFERFLETLIGSGELPSTRQRRRADFIGILVSRQDGGGIRLCFLPIEVKHHGSRHRGSTFPLNSDRELGRAREQLRHTAELLRAMPGAMGLDNPGGWEAAYLRRVGLATLVELAFSLSGEPVPVTYKSDVLSAILSGRFKTGVVSPLLLWFQVGAAAAGGNAHRLNPFLAQTPAPPGQEVFVDPDAAPALFWENKAPTGNEDGVRKIVDQAIEACFKECPADDGGAPTTDDRHLLESRLLGSTPHPSLTKSTAAPREVGGTTKHAGDHAPLLQGPTTPGKEMVRAATPATGRDVRPQSPPGYYVGDTKVGRRWTILGKMVSDGLHVGLDLDYPKVIGVFGYMGSGKSYLLGSLTEAAVKPIPGINSLPAPLAVIIFNYRRNYRERFELASLVHPNDVAHDVEVLRVEYNARPTGLDDLHILCLPGELNDSRRQEYGDIPASELVFRTVDLDMEDWELLMGQPSSDRVYAQAIRLALRDLHGEGQRIDLERLAERLQHLPAGSQTAALQRLDFARHYLSAGEGSDFGELVKPGRVLIIDLRGQLFKMDDALRFFLVCANQVGRVQGAFNKLVIFDEAHEYLSEAFGQKIESRVRYARHEGATYLFATQDVRSIPGMVRRWIQTKIVFNLGTHQNAGDLVRFAPGFKGCDLLAMPTGQCLVSSNRSLNQVFREPQLVEARPRVTKHGGGTKIFSG